MTREQQQSILTLALLAAFTDGGNNDREREQIRHIAVSLCEEVGANGLTALYQQVLLKHANLTDAAATLIEPAHRQLAYEMAVCICDADGRMTPLEEQFLTDLALALSLEPHQTDPAMQQAEAIAELVNSAAPAALTTQPKGVATQPVAASMHLVSSSVIDDSILKHSIINGALELLPQTWASMAVIPMQIKMVYGIGKMYGYELDQGHIRELLATMGVGLSSQYLALFGRKLLGGLLDNEAGGLAKPLGSTAAGAACSFATTYTIGQLAKRYFAGDMQMCAETLEENFQNLVGPASEIQAQYLAQIQQKASSLNMEQIIDLVHRT